MIKAVLINLGALPSRGRVALRAVVSETTLMLVLVARGAKARESKESMIQVFIL
jgi:hypothetical protein